MRAKTFSKREGALWMLVASAGLLGLGMGGPAFAEPTANPAPATVPSPAAKAEARERFDRGVRLFEKGENASALAEFKRANELIPTPLVLYNMGLVYAAMNRPVEAFEALGAYLGKAAPAQRAQRKHASEVRDEQSTRIARLMVKTEVPATVDIDGLEVARTPLAQPISVASGAHVVGAQAPGYLPTRKEVTLAGQVTETLVLTLLPAGNRLARLTVTSSPIAADVLVNGEKVGSTPLPASLSVAPGTVRVELRRSGYLRAEQTVTLGDGAQSDLTFPLQEDPSAPPATRGVLRVLASEAEAEVSVDGLPRRAHAGAFALPVGPHALRVTCAGFEPFEQTIAIPPTGEERVAATLVPTPEMRARYESSVRGRRWAGWSVLSVGAVLAVAGGVYGATKLKDVSDARKYRDGVLDNEADRNNLCYAQGLDYGPRGCGAIKSDAERRVDSAVLRRNLGFVGGAVGLVAAGIGGYLLLGADDPHRYRRSGGLADLRGAAWLDGHAGGVLLLGRY